MYKDYSIKQLQEIGPECWEIARDEGNKYAPVLLGLAYAEGTSGLKVDEEKAILNFNIAMERGEGFAAFQIGVLYQNKNEIDKAMEYYKCGASMGWNNALVSCAFVCLSYEKNYKRGREYLNEYFERESEIKDSNKDIYITACDLMINSYLHDNVSVEDMNMALKYIKIVDENGGSSNVDHLLGQFYRDGINFEKDVDKAIFYLDRNGDYYSIAKICIDEFNDYNKALLYYKKAYNEQKNKDGSSAAYDIVAINYFEELRDVVNQNIEEVEFYCREILDKEIMPTLMHMPLGILAKIYNNQDIDNYILSERNDYLFNNINCLAYVSDENLDAASCTLIDLMETLCFNNIALEKYDIIEGLYREIYQFITANAPGLKPAYQIGEGNKAFVFGLLYLENNMLVEAKTSLERAKCCGREDADNYLRRFSTNLFGKLTYK